MNLDDMAREAMSRVNYAVNANAEYAKKQMAEKFRQMRGKEKIEMPFIPHFVIVDSSGVSHKIPMTWL